MFLAVARTIELDPGEDPSDQRQAGKALGNLTYLWMLAAERCTRFASSRDAQARGARGEQPLRGAQPSREGEHASLYISRL
jgi:hypothetical protein